MRHTRWQARLVPCLAALGAALAACHPAPPATSDAGHVPVGAPCSSASACNGGQCLTQFTGGYCSTTCSAKNPCGAGATCASLGEQSVCLASCMSASDCRTGYACNSGTCTPPCQADSDCPAAQLCDVTTGQCTTSGFTGSSCTTDIQCLQGPDPSCLPSSEGFPGGACTSTCIADSDCGANNVCIATPPQQSGLDGEWGCMPSCTASSDCRTGYVCQQLNGKSFCSGPCAADTDCVNGQTCDTTTGVCQGEPADAGPGADAGFTEATFPSTPEVVDSGGPFLQNPVLVPIFFSNDDPEKIDQAMDFLNGLGATQWWGAISEYGVGTPMVPPKIVISTAAPSSITDDGIQAWLSDNIGNALPQNDPNTIYVLHYPAGTTISYGGGQSTSCNDFGGYHSDFQMNENSDVAYAVIPRCPGGYGLTDLDTMTTAESHEILEASTDPYPNDDPAYASVDTNHIVWAFANEGSSEIGDMCENDPEAYAQFADSPYTVQRFWSNSSAHNGHDPCVPILPGEIYFAAAPVLPDMVEVTGFGEPFTTPGVNIPLNTSKDVTIELYSDGPLDPWNVQVSDISSAFGGSPTMDITLNTATGNNGDTITATIKPIAQGPYGAGLDIFMVIVSQGQVEHFTFGMVGEPAE